MKYEEIKKLKIPDRPGIYFFLKEKKVIYIGKATSLKDRVRSYLSKEIFNMRGPLVEKMVQEADKVDWKLTDSVLEALILEANLIKKYQPKYNTKEKSDKSFLCVVITDEKLPRIMLVRSRTLQENPGVFKNIKLKKVFGPFTSGSQLKEGIKIIRKIFPFLDDKSKNYEEFYRQINLIPDLKDRKMYLQNIRNISLFFQGKKKKILQNLKKEMKKYAQNKEFEKAGEVKRQLFALQHINDVALIKESYIKSTLSSGPRFPGSPTPARPLRKGTFDSTKPFRIEAYDIAHMSGKNMVGVMVVIEDGEVLKSDYKKFKIRTQTSANDIGALTEALDRRLTHTEWAYSDLIAVDGGVAQLNAIKKVLKKTRVDIPVVSVVKDMRHKPKAIMGDTALASEHKKSIILANSEAHRFAISYHKKIRAKNFLK